MGESSDKFKHMLKWDHRHQVLNEKGLWYRIASYLMFSQPMDDMIYVCGGRN